MCAITGAIFSRVDKPFTKDLANGIMERVWCQSVERGRDGMGYALNLSMPGLTSEQRCTSPNGEIPICPALSGYHLFGTMIGNLRAEPTTEYVKEKRGQDQQPYELDSWSIVHNGTIANDRELRTNRLDTTIDSASIAEILSGCLPTLHDFKRTISHLKGSFAIIASHKHYRDRLFVACNYRPVWYIKTDVGVFFASSRNYFPKNHTPIMMKPYTAAVFSSDGIVESADLNTSKESNVALVVCSGGLDSVVSAVYASEILDMDLHLIHFLYGSRAEGPEVEAVKAVAKELGAKLTLFPLNIYDKEDSPLLNGDAVMATGETGAEFAHEWVPARNLVMLSVASAFAEAKKISTIVLGNNMEEAGAYPDNEPEFIAKFNDIIPFAVGDGKKLEVIMPVGNLMKHEIVKLGLTLKAPMHLTWSCYNSKTLHCGTCAPCFMRRKAFEINGADEVIKYGDENV